MKVLVIVKATKSSEAGELPSTELLAAMGQYNEELVNAGIMLDGVGLKPSSQGARVRFSGTSRTVMDGPFTETKELIAGYWIWQVKDLQEAIDWVKKCPNPMPEDSEIEIRPFFEVDDFGEAFTPELREQEAALRAVELGLNKPAFVQGEELFVGGLNQHYTQESRIRIPQQWDRFVTLSGEILGSCPPPHFGVCWNNGQDCSFDYLTAMELTGSEKLPAEFTTLKLTSRRYAVFPHTDHVHAIARTIDTIWSKWVPDAAVKVSRSAPCFERYTAEFNPTTGLGGMEIWIPLES